MPKKVIRYKGFDSAVERYKKTCPDGDIDYVKTISDLIKKGMSQQDIEDVTGVYQSSISALLKRSRTDVRYEKGERLALFYKAVFRRNPPRLPSPNR